MNFPLTAHEVPLTSFFLATHLMVCLGKLENLRLHSGTAEAFHDLLGGAPSGVPGVRKNLSGTLLAFGDIESLDDCGTLPFSEEFTNDYYRRIT